MNTLYYNLTSNENTGQSYQLKEKIKISQGLTRVQYNLNDLYQETSQIIKIEANFNDKSPIYIRDYRFDTNYDILEEPIIHDFSPVHDNDSVIYYPTVYITYLDFTILSIQTPIKIKKPSFYSEHKRMVISDIQFIDEMDDPIFATLRNKNGDIINLKIK
jgi:hypothetical protein